MSIYRISVFSRRSWDVPCRGNHLSLGFTDMLRQMGKPKDLQVFMLTMRFFMFNQLGFYDVIQFIDWIRRWGHTFSFLVQQYGTISRFFSDLHFGSPQGYFFCFRIRRCCYFLSMMWHHYSVGSRQHVTASLWRLQYFRLLTGHMAKRCVTLDWLLSICRHQQ